MHPADQGGVVVAPNHPACELKLVDSRFASAIVSRLKRAGLPRTTLYSGEALTALRIISTPSAVVSLKVQSNSDLNLLPVKSLPTHSADPAMTESTCAAAISLDLPGTR
jgi:hypothetical protein